VSTWEPGGPVAVVTGAGTGIGAAAAELFLERGYALVAVDVSGDALAWCADNPAVRVVVGDVSAPETSQAMVSVAVADFGRLDAVVLNAGIARRTDWESDDAIDLYDRVMEVNARSVMLGIRSAAPVMAASGGGAITVVGSTAGVRADPLRWAYNASKAAAINLARAAALDWGARGVRVNVAAPGPTLTPILQGGKATPEQHATYTRNIPMARLGTPREQAEVIYFLSSPAASFVTGAVYLCDGGVTANVGLFAPPTA
jgi:NAD(P)-dependent dehydrogenase (short-subunit alcohol dehydrogenase family)